MASLRTERKTDEAALVRNARRLIEKSKGKALIAVLKADAYGNGAVRCAKALEGTAAMIAVATASEAQALVRNKIKVPVLIIGTLTPQEQRLAARLDGVRLSVSSLSEAARLDAAARDLGKKIAVHIAVDSGMHRFGFAPDSKTIGLMSTFRDLRTEGIYTHYARADDAVFTARQCEVFSQVVNNLQARGLPLEFVHAANSAAVLLGNGVCGNAVRTGLALYGTSREHGMEPVASVTARVIAVRTLERGESTGYGCSFVAERRMRIAIVSAGYADGVPLSLSDRGLVLIGGMRCKIVGSVCMDVLTCDISAAGYVSEGDAAVIVGKDGREELTLSEQASLAATSAYELSVNLARARR